MYNKSSTLNEYVSNWKLKLNVEKSEAISILGHYKDLTYNIRKLAKEIQFKINGTIIENKKSIKYLGVIFASNFQFNEHIKHILKKVNAANEMLKNIFRNKLISESVKLLAYKQLIRPLILYASPIWAIKNLFSSAQIEKLRIKERHFLRHCLKLFRNPTNNNKYYNSKILYTKSKINRIDRELIQKNMKYVQKCKNNHDEAISNLYNHN